MTEKRRCRFLVISLLTFLCFGLAPLFSFQAGTCKVDITPPVGTPLAGFGARQGAHSTAVLDTLHARVLDITTPDTEWVIVSVDTLLFFSSWAEDVSRQLKFKPTFLTISASHTHAGSGGMLKEGGDALGAGPFRPKIYRAFIKKIVSCVESAHKHQKAVLLGTASAPLSPEVAHNRRLKKGKIDGQIRVLKVVSKEHPDQVIALLYNLSAHPTTIGGTAFSADFPGYASYFLEQIYPNSVALFVNGTQGDQGPGNPCHLGGIQRTRCLGFAVGWAALKLAEGITAGEPVFEGKEQWLLLNPKLNIFVKVQAFRLGNVAWLTIPGEAFVQLGNLWKEAARRLGFAHLFLMGLTNDAIGYIVYPESVYHLHIYESMFSFFGPHLGDFLLEQGKELLQDLSPPTPSKTGNG